MERFTITSQEDEGDGHFMDGKVFIQTPEGRTTTLDVSWSDLSQLRSGASTAVSTGKPTVIQNFPSGTSYGTLNMHPSKVLRRNEAIESGQVEIVERILAAVRRELASMNISPSNAHLSTRISIRDGVDPVNKGFLVALEERLRNPKPAQQKRGDARSDQAVAPLA